MIHSRLIKLVKFDACANVGFFSGHRLVSNVNVPTLTLRALKNLKQPLKRSLKPDQFEEQHKIIKKKKEKRKVNCKL